MQFLPISRPCNFLSCTIICMTCVYKLNSLYKLFCLYQRTEFGFGNRFPVNVNIRLLKKCVQRLRASLTSGYWGLVVRK